MTIEIFRKTRKKRQESSNILPSFVVVMTTQEIGYQRRGEKRHKKETNKKNSTKDK